MSLWDKWEREKQERMGIKVERKNDVEIHDTRLKPDIHKQVWIVGGVLMACLLVVYFALFLNERYGGSWTDSFVARLLAEKQMQRQSMTNNP